MTEEKQHTSAMIASEDGDNHTAQSNDRFSASKGLFAGDNTPETIFGIPIVSTPEAYTDEDLEFFRAHPEAGGYYDMGGEQNEINDGSEEGAPTQADMPPTQDEAPPTQDSRPKTKWGYRPDGTPKGDGWLGVQKNANGDFVTEHSIQSNAVKVDGKRIDFPLLVPTLTTDELGAVLAASAKNEYDKNLFASAEQKAVDFARDRLSAGLSVWAPTPASAEALAFEKRNPTLFNHVKEFEKLSLTPYRDIGGAAIGYGAHRGQDGETVTLNSKAVSKAMADLMLARDLYTRRQKLASIVPNWKFIPGNAKQALLDVSMGKDGILSEATSKALRDELRKTKNPKELLEIVKRHYYSYRNSDDPKAKAGLEARRIAGGKTFFGEDFSYENKVWDKETHRFVDKATVKTPKKPAIALAKNTNTSLTGNPSTRKSSNKKGKTK